VSAGASIADFGCGTGRCVKWFVDNGYDAVGVDIASNALEESVPFINCALWDETNLPKVDYGFSVDVLEHIPSERVRQTLMAIYNSVRVGCYFNIDTIPDSFGAWIGQTLHLTVLSAAQWEALLKEFWPSVELIRDDGRQAVFICKR
jgi:2-polyprenyl-3-methyl-5-hydroxy-6-metoxy-1,4-benzoquinol methylase